MDWGKTANRVWKFFLGGMLFVFLLVLSIRFNLLGLYGDIPSLEVLENPKSELASEIYSEDLELLGKYYLFNRTEAKSYQLPTHLVNALIATEDVRFYSHDGIDMKGTFAIFLYAIIGSKRGSSTITQQLAKNLFKIRRSKEYTGPLSTFMPVIKIKEIVTAIRLENAYTKREILTMYLNTVDFGHDAFGINSGARIYFNTTTSKLTLTESALLIGMLKGPSVYDPLDNEERAFLRRNTVLEQMNKYGYLSEEQLNDAKKIPLNLEYTPERQQSGIATYFRNYLRQHYIEPWCDEHGYDLNSSGLKIYTTINAGMQRAAEDAVRDHMSFLQKQFNAQWKHKAPWTDANYNEIKGFVEKMAKRSFRYISLKKSIGDNHSEIIERMKKKRKMKVFSWKGPIDTLMSPLDSISYYMRFLQTGFVSMDPHNGQIKAWVGGINYRYFNYDHVKQGKRQPGSTFKPILYSYAMEELGMNPCTKLLDVPVNFPTSGGKVWSPRNSDGNYSNNYLTLKQALAGSVNTISARIMQQIGPDSIVSFAKRMGIESPLEPVPTLCLGTSDVNLLEMVAAYCVFVNNGFYNSPQFITRIEDKFGNVLEEFTSVPKQVISQETAYNMIELLRGATHEGGTAARIRNTYGLTHDMGGKTGTTQGSADGWFFGVTPDLVSGCWVGGEDRSIRFRGMTYGQGAAMALPIWAQYMKKVYANHSIQLNKGNFPVPEGMTPFTDCDSLGGSPNTTSQEVYDDLR